jgi:hypothetical protein
MFSEHIIYLIQCWTGFRHIISKFNEKFPNIVSRMRNAVTSLTIEKIRNSFKELRCRVELYAEIDGE